MDAVFEMAGGRVFDESLKALAPFGRLVAYGIASREQNEVHSGAPGERTEDRQARPTSEKLVLDPSR